VLTCGLFNSSFIGFPLIKALYGNDGLQIAIMVDQPGSFLVLSTLGIAIASYYSSGKTATITMLQKVIYFPPFWGFIIAFIVKFLNYPYPEFLQNILAVFANTLSPLALISLGMQLTLEKDQLFAKELYVGLAYKLIIAPALLFFVFVILLGKNNLAAQVSIMEGAMAPMITAAIIASQYNLDRKLASTIIGIGIPLSFITLGFWYWLLNQFI
jgi:malate permease and related proteins